MAPARSPRELNVCMAKLAQKAERYEDMANFMGKVAADADNEELTVEERNLLSVAYSHVIGARRASRRIISSIETDESRGNEDHDIIRDYRSKLESEVVNICDDILNLLESHLIPSAFSGDSKVLYLKMKADYLRYLAELKTGAELKLAADTTIATYKSAQDIANAELPPTHPLRLGLALNFGVFYYEILESPVQAYFIGKKALDEAKSKLKFVGKESLQKSTSIMKCLSDNLIIWTSELQKDGGAAAQPDEPQE
uniref:14-3-3-like protein n=1 Tax=Cicer arietinum TaxID=3827 RepID=A0A1S3E6K8_CICAR|nr:14-3-3-like protein [Cicer arietinum]XP_027190675.1 14-3-3-like protein [Cicer arietinum]